MSLVTRPRCSRSCRAWRTPAEFRPATPINSSVETPSSGSAAISAFTRRNKIPRRVSVRSCFAASAWRASSTDCTRNDDGNTCTRFSSRLSNAASSNQATAVFTRVSPRRAVAFEGVVVVFNQDLSRRRHHFAMQLTLAVDIAQRPEDAVDFAAVEPGARRHAELPFDIVGCVEQHTTRELTVPGRRGPLPAGSSPATPGCRHESPAGHRVCRYPCRTHWWRQ